MKNMIDQIARSVPSNKGKNMTDKTVPPTKKRGGFSFYRKAEPDPELMPVIIRQDGNGNEIRKTCGSIGYQIFCDGKFKTFVTGLEEANAVLDKLKTVK